MSLEEDMMSLEDSAGESDDDLSGQASHEEEEPLLLATGADKLADDEVSGARCAGDELADAAEFPETPLDSEP